MKIITDEIVKNKKILIRLDLDVPLDQNNSVKDTTRLASVIPTLELLKNAEQIIIIGHLGRPDGKIVDNLRLKPVAEVLKQFIGNDINYIDTLDDHAIRESLNKNEKWNIIENLRFHPGEEANDSGFAQQLAQYGQIFVFEAFAVSHRSAASTLAITEYLPVFGGLRVAKEVETLSHILETPEHPFLAIIGGAKIETKVPVINNLVEKADTIFIGGKLIKEIKDTGMTFGPKVYVGSTIASGLDINEESIQYAQKVISEAKLIVWNGPAGKFEDPSAQQGTHAIAVAVANSQAKKIIGGGETNEAVTQFGVQDKIDFISVGGGAMLEFLAGKELPALAALNKED
jgi:phosphoglycerate kinase